MELRYCEVCGSLKPLGDFVLEDTTCRRCQVRGVDLGPEVLVQAVRAQRTGIPWTMREASVEVTENTQASVAEDPAGGGQTDERDFPRGLRGQLLRAIADYGQALGADTIAQLLDMDDVARVRNNLNVAVRDGLLVRLEGGLYGLPPLVEGEPVRNRKNRGAFALEGTLKDGSLILKDGRGRLYRAERVEFAVVGPDGNTYR